MVLINDHHREAEAILPEETVKKIASLAKKAFLRNDDD